MTGYIRNQIKDYKRNIAETAKNYSIYKNTVTVISTQKKFCLTCYQMDLILKRKT